MLRHYCQTAAWLILLASAGAQGDECQLTLSQPSLDFGVFNRALQSTRAAEHRLGEQRLSLTLSCAQDTDLSLFYRALGENAERFRFAEHGNYALRLSEGMLDGQTVDLGLSAGSGQPLVAIAAQLYWRPDLGLVPVRAGVPQRGKNFSVHITVDAWAREPALSVLDAVTWNSSGLFEAGTADASRELQLRASFEPAACEPSLSSGGVVDFGRLSRQSLNAQEPTRLPLKSLMLNISCDAPALFALRMQDNRDGSATVNSEIYYGLGLDGGGNKIGLYSLVFDPALSSADDIPSLFRTDSTTSGIAWSTSSSTPIPIGASSYLGFSNVSGSSAGPVAVQYLSSQVTVEAIIAPTKSLDLSSEVALDGSGTVEIIYL